MARSTPVIALVGAGILVVAVGAAALRGTDGSSPTDDATDTVAPTATDTGAATPVPTETETTTPAPTDSPTPDPTDSPTDAVSPTPTPTGTAAGTDADGDTDPDGDTDTAGADGDDTDDNVAMGSTDEVQDTPNTGGGALAVLGGAVAAGALVAGRRPRG